MRLQGTMTIRLSYVLFALAIAITLYAWYRLPPLPASSKAAMLAPEGQVYYTSNIENILCVNLDTMEVRRGRDCIEPPQVYDMEDITAIEVGCAVQQFKDIRLS